MDIVTYLKFKLGAAEVGPLLLPEVVGLDDEGNVDARWERLLKDLQQRLDAVPFRATHVHNDREAMPRHFLAKRDRKRKRRSHPSKSTSKMGEKVSFKQQHLFLNIQN